MRQWTVREIAAHVGVQPSTIEAYKARGQMPPPTGHVGRTPYWSPADIQPWIDKRRTRTS